MDDAGEEDPLEVDVDDPGEEDVDDPGEEDCVKAGARAGFHSTEAPCGALSASTHLLLQSAIIIIIIIIIVITITIIIITIITIIIHLSSNNEAQKYVAEGLFEALIWSVLGLSLKYHFCSLSLQIRRCGFSNLP